jgi:hypothetical protein
MYLLLEDNCGVKIINFVLDGRGATRKKRKVSGASGFSGVSVSQLLAQREQNIAAGTPPQVKEPAGRAPQVSMRVRDMVLELQQGVLNIQ